MGFESFLVTLQGSDCTFAEICRGLEEMDGVTASTDVLRLPPSQYYSMADGKHVIEMEVAPCPVCISCRFALCHPQSVDDALVALVRKLMLMFHMDVRIRDAVQPQHAIPFQLAKVEDFSLVVRGYIASRRSEWIANFGSAQLGCGCREAEQRFVLPRCI